MSCGNVVAGCERQKRVKAGIVCKRGVWKELVYEVEGKGASGGGRGRESVCEDAKAGMNG